ncbi:RNA polymerase sigma factor [Corallococcus sp. bb12-1]|uniref:RNA polymerase sigma factor n=1 Tax=Corallococcus sp. bb12-1 TaxID=2996784 RepID=UPI00226EF9E8|nr:RNA polymerase sigma factor [Corallococcus sp. bb12-1]MCY1043268.1 RNA polymerase sigma factor [Corallococcus sp. bb12-1]
MVQEASEGSDREYATFALRHQPILLAVARNICGRGANECDDLVQDVLLRALLKWDKLQEWSEPAKRAWLVRVLHNRFLDRCRRRGTETAQVLGLSNVHKLFEDPEAPDPELWECVTEAELREAVCSLPPNLRRTFELHAQGLRHAEIGQQLGAPVGTVGTWLFHARHRLREKLRGSAEARRERGRG